MASKEEIKALFLAELETTPLNGEIALLKQHIIDEIARPNIILNIVYNFTHPLSEDELGTIILLCKLEFGFIPTNFSMNCISIDMSKFLE
jgi:hypothetical protein